MMQKCSELGKNSLVWQHLLRFGQNSLKVKKGPNGHFLDRKCQDALQKSLPSESYDQLMEWVATWLNSLNAKDALCHKKNAQAESAAEPPVAQPTIEDTMESRTCENPAVVDLCSDEEGGEFIDDDTFDTEKVLSKSSLVIHDDELGEIHLKDYADHVDGKINVETLRKRGHKDKDSRTDRIVSLNTILNVKKSHFSKRLADKKPETRKTATVKPLKTILPKPEAEAVVIGKAQPTVINPTIKPKYIVINGAAPKPLLVIKPNDKRLANINGIPGQPAKVVIAPKIQINSAIVLGNQKVQTNPQDNGSEITEQPLKRVLKEIVVVNKGIVTSRDEVQAIAQSNEGEKTELASKRIPDLNKGSEPKVDCKAKENPPMEGGNLEANLTNKESNAKPKQNKNLDKKSMTNPETKENKSHSETSEVTSLKSTKENNEPKNVDTTSNTIVTIDMTNGEDSADPILNQTDQTAQQGPNLIRVRTDLLQDHIIRILPAKPDKPSTTLKSFLTIPSPAVVPPTSSAGKRTISPDCVLSTKVPPKRTAREMNDNPGVPIPAVPEVSSIPAVASVPAVPSVPSVSAVPTIAPQQHVPRDPRSELSTIMSLLAHVQYFSLEQQNPEAYQLVNQLRISLQRGASNPFPDPQRRI
ncbi:hypothetical protein KR009_003123 [Drosophila setifemur]|nr:hypothetical protein KR009_003123 [Drosophila setifemur]